MFGSLGKLVGDVVEVVTAPVEVALDVTRLVTKPIADTAQTVAKEVKDATDSVLDD